MQVRSRLGLARDAHVALIVAGSLGLGGADEAARAISAYPGWVPVVSCGRNESLRQQIEEEGTAIALGWVDDMASLMDAADVLVENAGGLSAKEALYRGLPVVTFRPLSGHGRDDANALERLGLTDVVDDQEALLHSLDRLVRGTPHRADRVNRGNQLFVGDAAAEIERLAGAEPVISDVAMSGATA